MSLPLILKRADGFYSIPTFESLGFQGFFTTRRFDMAFEAVDRSKKFSRKKAYQKIALDGSWLVCPSQVHGVSIGVVSRKDRGKGAYVRSAALKNKDALMTNEPGLAIAILTADCLPLFMVDTRKKAICLVHAGWKGLHKKIITQAIQQMRKVFQTDVSDLVIALGPTLRPCCYEVGKEFIDFFPGATSFRGGKLYLDMANAAAAQLLKSGVESGQIYDTHLCTSCLNQEFFSYRREGERAGRSMSILKIA